MIFGALLAGGVGSRMNIENIPKQFLPLGSETILMHTLDKFLLCEEFEAIYIGVHRDWVDFTKDVLSEKGVSGKRVRVVCGGRDRNGTIMSIVDSIEKDFGEDGSNIVVTHDSVRPFVKVSTINASIEAARLYGACDTVISATDTIVKSADGEFVSSIPFRGEMYQGQTPQAFSISKLKTVYAELSDEEKSALTDACKIFVLKGYPVALIEGDVTNIKLTTPMDYKVAQAMLESGIE